MFPGLFVRVAMVAGGPPVVGPSVVAAPPGRTGGGGAAGKVCAPVAGWESKNVPRPDGTTCHCGLPAGIFALRAAAAWVASPYVEYSSDVTGDKLYGLPTFVFMPGMSSCTTLPWPPSDWTTRACCAAAAISGSFNGMPAAILYCARWPASCDPSPISLVAKPSCSSAVLGSYGGRFGIQARA